MFIRTNTQVFDAALRESRAIQRKRMAAADREREAMLKRVLAREERDRRKAEHEKLQQRCRAAEDDFREYVKKCRVLEITPLAHTDFREPS